MAPNKGQTHTKGKQRLAKFHETHPEATRKEMVEETGLSESYVGRYRRDQGLSGRANNPTGINQYSNKDK